MTVEQLTLDLWGTPSALDESAVIAEITALAEQVGWTAKPTHVWGALDFYVSPRGASGCTFATPEAARRMLAARTTA